MAFGVLKSSLGEEYDLEFSYPHVQKQNKKINSSLDDYKREMSFEDCI